jgi:hypothetical protein
MVGAMLVGFAFDSWWLGLGLFVVSLYPYHRAYAAYFSNSPGHPRRRDIGTNALFVGGQAVFWFVVLSAILGLRYAARATARWSPTPAGGAPAPSLARHDADVRAPLRAPTLIRRRVVQAMIGVVLLGAAPVVARYIWPSWAPFIPPSLLVLVIAASVVLALLVWRTEWVVRLLVSEPLSPDRLAGFERTAHAQRVRAMIGLVAAAGLLGLWVTSIL